VERETAEAFVADWTRCWNRHDLEGVLSHFSDKVVFTSPHADQLLPGSEGVVRGKDSLRRYWRTGLERVPDLHFVVLGVYVGVNTLVINYRNQRGGLVNEVLTFTDGLVTEGHGTYIESVPYHVPSTTEG
jgi:ketosteroid isomerase-like protein